MIGYLLHKYVAAFERKYNYDAAYLHELADISPRDFYGFAKVQMTLQSKHHAPNDALQAAAIGGALVEDCGPCVQIASDRAVEAGMSRRDHQSRFFPVSQPDPMRNSVSIMRARCWTAARTCGRTAPETIEARWSKRGLIALTFMAMAARNFPVIKRALGHARTCQSVRVGNADIVVEQSLKGA